MTEVLVGAVVSGVSVFEPYVLRSCILVPAVPPLGVESENIISTPVPPGVVYEALPAIDVLTEIVNTSPGQIIGCANELPVTEREDVLSALFPGALEEDGVVDRTTNDVWVYRGGQWVNVGPTPGPQLVVTSVLPPWNQTIFLRGVTKSKISLKSFGYALEKSTDLGEFRTVAKIEVDKQKVVSVPAVLGSISAEPPSVSIAIPKLGKVVEIFYYTGNGTSRTLLTSWPPGIFYVSPVSPSGQTGFYDAARPLTNRWSPDSNSSQSVRSPAIQFNEDSVALPGADNGNANGTAYYAFVFRGCAPPATNSAGSIQSTVYSSEAYSISTYTGNAVAGATVGHGLGVVPDFVIIKNLQSGFTAYCGGTTVGGYSQIMPLNSTSQRYTDTTILRTITGQTVEIGGSGQINGNGQSHVMYSFKNTPSRLKAGVYVGNGLASGQYIDFGFEPNMVIIKSRNRNGSWIILTTKMNPQGTRYATWDYVGEYQGTLPFYSFEDNGIRVFDELTYGYNDSQLNSFGIEYVYIAFAAGFYNEIPQPVLSVQSQVGAASVSAGASVDVPTVALSVDLSPVPYVGEYVAIVSTRSVRPVVETQAPQVSSGARLDIPCQSISGSPGLVNFAGRAVPEALSYISTVESVDGASLESAVKGAVLRFVNRLKDTLLWDKISTIVPMCGARTINGALVPLKGTHPDRPVNQDTQWSYRRLTGLVPTAAVTFYTNIFGSDLNKDNNHMLAYVYEDTPVVSGGDLMGNSLGGASIALTSPSSNANFQNSNYAATNTTVSPTWSKPSLVGMARGSSSSYVVRLGEQDRTVTATAATVPDTGEIRLFNFWNGVGYYRIPLYSLGENIDLGLYEQEIRTFLEDLSSALSDGVVSPVVTASAVQAHAPVIS